MDSQRVFGMDRRARSTDARRPRRIALTALVAAVGLVLGPQLTTAGAEGTPGPGGTTPAAAGAAQISEGGGVTVQVTWDGPSTGPVFRVVMNTHAVDLDQYDLRALAVLRTEQGTDMRPSAWDAPKGGHHREGTLTFPAQGPDGKAVFGPDARGITLIIRDVAGVPERTFRWTW